MQKNKINIKLWIVRIILCILLITIFSITFGFSSQDSTKSSSISQATTEILVKNNREIQELDEKDKMMRIDELETIVRKLAHFSIYTVIGSLLILLHSTYNISLKRRIIQSFGIGVIYAITDEIHQIFTPGRSAEIRDVLIDSLGVAFGIVIILLIMKLIKKCKKYYEQHNI